MKIIYTLFFLVITTLNASAQFGDLSKAVQKGWDVVRGKEDPGKIVKKWYDELEDEVSKAVGMTLEVSGDILEFVGEEGGRVVKFSEQTTRDLIKVNQKFVELGPDVVDAITPDGPWRIDLGVVEVKSHKSIDERLRDYNNEVADELNNAVTISRDIFSTAAKGVEYSGTLTKFLGKYLAASSQGFPQLYVNSVSDISPFDRSIFISNGYLNKMINQLTKQPISYGEGDKEYIQFNQLTFQFIESHNSIKLIVNDGIVGWDGGEVRGAIKIKTAEIQLIPVLSKIDEKYQLRIGARMVNLNLKDVPPKFDEMMAWAIQDLAFAEPIMNEDISELMTIKDVTTIKGKKISKTEFQEQKREINIQAKEAVVVIEDGRFKIIMSDIQNEPYEKIEMVSVKYGKRKRGLGKKIRDKLGIKFPDPPSYIEPEFVNRDFSLTLSHNTLNEYLRSLIGDGLTFPLDDDLDKSLSNDFVKINPLSDYQITKNGTIRLVFNGSVHFKKFFAKINLTIEEIVIEIVPEIIQIEGDYYFSMKTAVTSLKINDLAPDFEKALANLIITKSLNQDKENISNDILFNVPHPFKDDTNLNPGFKNVGIVIDNNKIAIVGEI